LVIAAKKKSFLRLKKSKNGDNKTQICSELGKKNHAL
jgi:hypothetical protein